jgi:hypothetical protein
VRRKYAGCGAGASAGGCDDADRATSGRCRLSIIGRSLLIVDLSGGTLIKRSGTCSAHILVEQAGGYVAQRLVRLATIILRLI